LGGVQELADTRVRQMTQIPGALHYLRALDMMDDRIVQHSVNVAVLTGVLGRWLGGSHRQIGEMILAGLLHDVGKMLINAEVAVKRIEELTAAEARIYRSHCVEGYRLLNSNAYNLPFNVLAGVLQHHEWIDGRGYPLALRGEKIHLFAKVIAIADLYDIMTSDGLKNHRITPWQAVEILVGQMFKKLDPEVAGIFLHQLREQLIGNPVRLNDGREALVVYLGTDIFQRPVVRTRDGGFIDLEKERSVSISEML
jgi:putative nucleotidyltransferase with HDIG domain